MRHAWYVFPQCRPLDSRGLKCWLQLACHWVVWGSIISGNTKQTAVGKLETIKHVLQMYGYPCSSMLALDLSTLISFWDSNRTDDQPHRKRVELHAMPNFDPYSMQWLKLASLFVEVHLSKAKVTSFHNGNCFLIASTVSAYSFRHMLLRVVADGRTRSSLNAIYDCHSSRFDRAFHGMCAETNPNMR